LAETRNIGGEVVKRRNPFAPLGLSFITRGLNMAYDRWVETGGVSALPA